MHIFSHILLSFPASRDLWLRTLSVISRTEKSRAGSSEMTFIDISRERRTRGKLTPPKRCASRLPEITQRRGSRNTPRSCSYSEHRSQAVPAVSVMNLAVNPALGNNNDDDNVSRVSWHWPNSRAHSKPRRSLSQQLSGPLHTRTHCTHDWRKVDTHRCRDPWSRCRGCVDSLGRLEAPPGAHHRARWEPARETAIRVVGPPRWGRRRLASEIWSDLARESASEQASARAT